MDRIFTFLGTGTSVGVPLIGCECGVCRSDHPRNQRLRCSALLRLPAGNLLIDTTPDLRLQLLRERVRLIHAVLFTHQHVDHLYGLDDLRPVISYLGKPMPVYCTEFVEETIRRVFSYAFTPAAAEMPIGVIPKFAFHRIAAGQPFEVLGQTIEPIALQHSKTYETLGFRVGDVAYCTDVNHIIPDSMRQLEGLDVLILDALRPSPHPTHLSIDEALAIIAQLRPKRAYLTHMSHELDYPTFNPQLPPNVEMAYDGLSFSF